MQFLGESLQNDEKILGYKIIFHYEIAALRQKQVGQFLFYRNVETLKLLIFLLTFYTPNFFYMNR